MNYKSYPKVKDTPQRMARKTSRREVFLFNKKGSKLWRKKARLARKTVIEENENHLD